MLARRFRITAIFCLLTLSLLSGVRGLQASSGGRTGVSKSATGCSCHSTIPNQNGSATVAITGPQEVAPGSISSYTISVSGGPAGTTGGFDLSTSGGTLTAGSNNKVSNGELTHSSNSARSWSFTWQAPATEGSYNFFAVAQSTNGSGMDGDSWNWYGGAVNTPFTIVVSTTGVGARGGALWLAPARPNPARAVARLAYSLAAAAPVRLEILDAAGRQVARLVQGTESAGYHEALWRGSNESGGRVSSGVYFARLTTGSSTLRTRINWVR